MRNKKISIIVPIYIVDNVYLKKCINSLLNQTYKNIEIILVNDGMTKESYDYLAKLNDDRIKRIGEVNKGLSYARNLGMSIATGEYVTFVDSDDAIDSKFCETMLETAERENSDCVICGFNRVYDNKSFKNNNKINFKYDSNQEFLIDLFHIQNAIGYAHMKLIKRKILIENNISFTEGLSMAEDSLFCIQMAKHLTNVVRIKETLYDYTFNSNSLVRKYDEKYCEKFLKCIKVCENYINEEYKNNVKIKKYFNNYVSYYILLIIVNYCYNPQNKKSFFEKYRLMKETCQIKEFAEAIKFSNYKRLSLSRKITLFSIKYKLYFITSAIATIRQLQFKVRKRRNEKVK